MLRICMKDNELLGHLFTLNNDIPPNKVYDFHLHNEFGDKHSTMLTLVKNIFLTSHENMCFHETPTAPHINSDCRLICLKTVFWTEPWYCLCAFLLLCLGSSLCGSPKPRQCLAVSNTTMSSVASETEHIGFFFFLSCGNQYISISSSVKIEWLSWVTDGCAASQWVRGPCHLVNKDRTSLWLSEMQKPQWLHNVCSVFNLY